MPYKIPQALSEGNVHSNSICVPTSFPTLGKWPWLLGGNGAGILLWVI